MQVLIILVVAAIFLCVPSLRRYLGPLLMIGLVIGGIALLAGSGGLLGVAAAILFIYAFVDRFKRGD